MTAAHGASSGAAPLCDKTGQVVFMVPCDTRQECDAISRNCVLGGHLQRVPEAARPPAVAQAIFHGTLHDCDGKDFSGHLPKGFVCRGAGTGVGICLKPGDRRVISYDVQGGPNLPPSGYCHLDWAAVNESQLKQDRRYMECKGANSECATAAFGKNPQ